MMTCHCTYFSQFKINKKKHRIHPKTLQMFCFHILSDGVKQKKF